MKKYLVLLAIMLLSSCGGGGGGSTPATNNTDLIINIVAAPVTGASCKVYKITSNARDTLLANATSTNGQATFKSFSYTGDALIQCAGGKYLDEASDATTSLEILFAALKLTAAIREYSVTPLTYIAYKIGAGDLNSIISTHNAKVAEQFGLDNSNDITHKKPIAASASNTNSNKYGLVLAALSQMGKDGRGTGNATSLLSVVQAVVNGTSNGELSPNIINNLKTSVAKIKSNRRFNFKDIDIADDFGTGTGGSTSPQISLTSNTLSYIYDGTVPTTPTAIITANSTTTGIVITGNIDKNVGTYILTYNATDSAGNKAIPQTATITITPKPITITANVATKVYGTANPVFTDNRAGKLVGNDILSGILGSNGVNIGTYDITSTLSNSNYDITFIGVGKFRITAIPGSSKPQINLASNTVSYVYGTTAIKPTATITANSTATSITISGNIGSDVGTYVLTYTAIDLAGNMAIPKIATVTITPKLITITANAVSKLQGSANNPTLSHDGANKLLGSDTLTGTLGSIGLSTSTVGTYDITSTLSNSNYIITFVGENKFSIDSKPQINIASKTLSYVYGTTPTIKSTATITSNSTTTGIIITGSIGSNVGVYVLTYNATDSAGNKAIPQIATVTITPKPITITANAVSKLQGSANNPTLSDDRLTKLSSGDILTGTLGSSGLSSSAAGSYDITSTLSNSNYIINFVGENKFSISPKPQINIASKTLSYVYGTTVIYSTATITSNASTTGITITGNIGSNVGVYILTYTATDSAGYKAIPQIATITITPKPVTVTANPATKVYGTANPSFTYVSVGLVASDTLSGILGSSAVNVGTHDIAIGSLSNNNYAITFVGASKLIITKKHITITANPASRVYGDANPKLSDDRLTQLVQGDILSGSLTVNASSKTSVDDYLVTSTLSNSNYVITFDGVNKFSITPRPVTITAKPATKVYGITSNPALSHDGATQILAGDSLTGTLGSSGLSSVNAGSYDITSTLSNSNYKINFVGVGKFLILKASQSAFSAGNNQDKTFVASGTSGTTFTIITTGSSSTSPATYSTSNANIATIDASGVITIKAAGTVTIGATSTADNNYKARYSSFILTISPSTSTINATATSYSVELAWSAVAGSGVSYKVYYASETIIDFDNLATNYNGPNGLSSGTLIDNIINPTTTVLDLKYDVVYYFVVTVLQNNQESVISNQVTATVFTVLNDTGIITGGDYPAGTNTICTSNISAPQDCHQGRDAKAASGTLSKAGGGSAGFDFTKLGSTGTILAIQNQAWSSAGTEAQGTKWSCVKDNVTGLIWEVKTTSGLHSKDATYTWYSTDTTANNGSSGTINVGGNTCDGYTQGATSTYCNTQAFVNRVNSGSGLCGAKNWQLPNIQQLSSIVDHFRINPSIDSDYFPNTSGNDFWSATPYLLFPNRSFGINFYSSIGVNIGHGHIRSVRLVRPRP